MRLNYYQFPENTPETVRLDNGCAVVLKAGDEIWTDCIPDDKRLLVDHVSFTLGPMTVTSAKKLLRLYGGNKSHDCASGQRYPCHSKCYRT